MDKIDICQINICGLSEKSKICLEKYLDNQNADIACISEIKTISNPTFKNFHHFYKSNSKDPNTGGVSVLLNQNFYGDRQSFLEEKDIDAVFVVANLKSQRYLVCSVYVAPQSPSKLKKFLKMLDTALAESKNLRCADVLVLGDLNARHQNWGDSTNNSHGNILNEYVSEKQLNIWSDYVGNSFQCTNGGSRIDFVINTKPVLYEQYLDEEVELFTGAPARGHIPVWSRIHISNGNTNQQGRIIFDWKNVSWGDFEYLMDELTYAKLPFLANVDDPNQLWLVAKDILLAAKDMAVPTKFVCQHSKPFWTKELTKLSAALREERKRYKNRSDFYNGERLRMAKENFNTALDNAKNSYIENQAQSLNNSDGQKLWDNIKTCLNSKSKASRYIGTIDYEGKRIVDDQEKTEIFKEEIFLGRHLKDCTFDSNFKAFVDKSILSDTFFESSLNESYNCSVTAEEIESALKSTKTSQKSVDNDGIHPLMLKHCGQQFRIILLKLFNGVFSAEKWPWMESNVILLQKAGKPNYNEVGSFRPISISSYVGKLLESILKCRLLNFLDERDVLTSNQHGFRKFHSTATYMAEMISEIQNNVKTKTFTAGLYVDLQKAFDSVWIEGLIFKLREIGIQGKLLKILSWYLSHRQTTIQVNETFGTAFNCGLGVPQGGVLSPTLFAIYINDMLSGISGFGKCLQYADDTSIILSDLNHIQLSEKCQSSCDKLTAWLSKWRLKANCSKTDLLVFYGNCDVPKLSGESINKCSSTKVLGITVDEKLNFEAHLNRCKNTLSQKWNMVKPFIYKGLSVQTSRFILLNVIMPKTHYLSFLWDFKNKFSVYSIVKDLGRIPFNPPTEHVFAFCNIQPLEIRYCQLRLSLARSLIKSGNFSFLDSVSRSAVKDKILIDCRQYLNLRHQPNSAELEEKLFTKAKIRKFCHDKWVKSYMNFCRSTPCCGLLDNLDLCWNVIFANRIPLTITPKIFGSICALLTGHCRLQLHLYKLNLTFSPTCICLMSDESPQHYLHECPLYDDVRLRSPPNCSNWTSLAQFIFLAGRKP